MKTALEVLAKEGLDAVTMRRVAQELETGPASLYAHVSNKDELAELMLDAVLADVPLPGTGRGPLGRAGEGARARARSG